MKDNLFVTILKLLNVKHTKKYSNRFFNEHPHKYNLYGLSKMLTHYKVSNLGIKIINKEEDLYNLPPPFIAHTGDDFAVVESISLKGVR